MNAQFNLNQLKAVYNDAWRRGEPTVAFELRDGPGRFVFMMFFAQEDEQEAKDQLFVLLGRTQTLLKLKMYGSHRKGDFVVYLNDRDQAAIRLELNLQGGPSPFNLVNFLDKLNFQIPQTLPLQKTVETLRGEKEFFKTNSDLRDLVDEASKIYLIGTRQLPPEKRPREKTLRKLYLHLAADNLTVRDFVGYLKRANCTVAWTDNPARANNDLLQMINNGVRPTLKPRRPSDFEGP